MTSSIESLYNNLNDIGDGIKNDIKNLNITFDHMKLFINKILNLENYDTYLLAGRLLIYSSIVDVPRKIGEYLEVMEEYLNERCVECMRRHEEYFDKLLQSCEEDNYRVRSPLASVAIVSYLMRTKGCSSIGETPCIMYLRQAIELYSSLKIEKDMTFEEIVSERLNISKCFHELLTQDYVHASPIMFNAGSKRNQMSSCFLVDAGDSLDTLMWVANLISKITKNNGATGISVSDIRCSSIANTGQSKGVLSFSYIYDIISKEINQGGKRNGNNTQSLRCFHLNIMEFIGMKDKTRDIEKKFHATMVCILLNSLFIERYRKTRDLKEKYELEGRLDEWEKKDMENDWTLFCPKKAEMMSNLYPTYEFGKGKKMFREGEMRKVRLFDMYAQDLDFWYPIFEEEAKKRREEYKKSIEDFEIYQKENFQSIIGLKGDRQECINKLRKLRNIMNKKKENLFNDRKVSSQKLMNEILDCQISSSNPFVVSDETINFMNNMKRIGLPVKNPNLCLEIIETHEEGEVASCNLANINLPKFCKGKVHEDENMINMNLGKKEKSKNYEDICEKLRESYDFQELGRVAKTLTRNINRVIDRNYYLGKEFEIPNKRDRPIGIGVSGLGNCFYKLNIYYDSYEADIFNRMIFACIYYNSLVESMNLAGVDGEYETFRTGKHLRYNILEKKFEERNGSPASCGDLQFDMWEQMKHYRHDIKRMSDEMFEKLNKNDKIIEITDFDGKYGEYKNWDELKKDIMKYGLRNSMLVAQMPTATSAQTMNNTESVELETANLYTRELVTGNNLVINLQLMEDLKNNNMWNQKVIGYIKINDGSLKGLCEQDFIESDKKDLVKHFEMKYPCMRETNLFIMAKMVRDRGYYICQSESHNVFVDQVSKVQLGQYHLFCNDLCLKTGMYYLHQRAGERESIGLSTLKKEISSKSENEIKKKESEEISNTIGEKLLCSIKNREECIACS